MNQAKVLKVLIADDEIPYGDERDQHTREEFRKTRPTATDEDYLKGYEGMRGACQALCNAEFDLTIARRFKEAENAIRDSQKPFDVAIIDLGWAAELDLEDRDNAGKRLVNALRTTEGGRRTRIIMYSSRFNGEEVLAESACRLGTLPLVKTYTKASHQTLVAAVRFLASPKPTPDEEVFSSILATWDERQSELCSLSKWSRILMVVIGMVLLAGVAMLWLGLIQPGGLTVASSVLVTLFLRFITTRIDTTVSAASQAKVEAKKQADSMRPRPDTA